MSAPRPPRVAVTRRTLFASALAALAADMPVLRAHRSLAAEAEAACVAYCKRNFRPAEVTQVFSVAPSAVQGIETRSFALAEIARVARISEEVARLPFSFLVRRGAR